MGGSHLSSPRLVADTCTIIGQRLRGRTASKVDQQVQWRAFFFGGVDLGSQGKAIHFGGVQSSPPLQALPASKTLQVYKK